MDYTMSEVLQFIKENDVKFIRLAFFDIFGTMKNISIMPSDLPNAFENGISFDGSAMKGFMNTDRSDLFLVPDPGTLTVLPWRPSQGQVIRMFCKIRYPDGTPFEGDIRNLLGEAEKRAEKLGYKCKIGTECEFYLFQMDENGNPSLTPHDKAGYCDIAPLDKGENVRREICLTLEAMGILPENSHHEQGPGQNEIALKFNYPLQAADNFANFKSVVKTIAANDGLHASFMPKPLPDESGSGLHINLSMRKNDRDIFAEGSLKPSPEAESFMEGILRRIPELTVFLNPLTNSYTRFGHYAAPRYITWSSQNRSQLIRIPASHNKYSRVELRSSDPSCNPHLAFSLLLHAGLDGIEEKLQLRPAVDRNLLAIGNQHPDLSSLPQNLQAAISLAENSIFVNRLLPIKVLEKYLSAKNAECDLLSQAENQRQFEMDYYFKNI